MKFYLLDVLASTKWEKSTRCVFDMIYNSLETHFLQPAKQRGAQIIPGMEMFVHQAARQFEIWTGKPAPQYDMLQVAMTALHERMARAAAATTKRNDVYITQI